MFSEDRSVFQRKDLGGSNFSAKLIKDTSNTNLIKLTIRYERKHIEKGYRNL